MWMKSLKDEDYVPERWGLKGLKGTWGLSPQNMWTKGTVSVISSDTSVKMATPASQRNP